MVVMTTTYRVVGMMEGHLIFQNTWKLVAPSTSAASMRDWSTLPRAATYSTMGWPMEVVNRMAMIQPRAMEALSVQGRGWPPAAWIR